MNENAGRGDFLLLLLRLETGEELPFIVDTGSPITVFDRSLESKLGKRLGTMGISTPGHKQEKSGIYAASKIYIGSTPLLTGSNVATCHLEGAMGILGMDCLQHYCIQLDFADHVVRFLNPDRMKVDGLGKGFPLTLARSGPQGRFVRPVIHHAGLVGADTNLLIDTGCRIDGLMAKGVNNGREPERLNISKCVWDGEVYMNIRVAAVDHANVLGLSFLARHLVTLDFPHRRMYLNRITVGS
jgi:hypothetical protein